MIIIVTVNSQIEYGSNLASAAHCVLNIGSLECRARNEEMDVKDRVSLHARKNASRVRWSKTKRDLTD